VQPNWLGREFVAMNDVIKEHPDFVAALRARGIEDLAFVDCLVLPPSYFGTDEQRGRRVGHATCSNGPGVRNAWTRGIENLTVVVDLDESGREAAKRRSTPFFDVEKDPLTEDGVRRGDRCSCCPGYGGSNVSESRAEAPW